MGILNKIRNYIPEVVLFTGLALFAFSEYKVVRHRPINSDIPSCKYTINQCFIDNPNIDNYAALEIILSRMSAPILILGGAVATRAKINGEAVSLLEEFTNDMREVQMNMQQVKRSIG